MVSNNILKMKSRDSYAIDIIVSIFPTFHLYFWRETGNLSFPSMRLESPINHYETIKQYLHLH